MDEFQRIILINSIKTSQKITKEDIALIRKLDDQDFNLLVSEVISGLRSPNDAKRAGELAHQLWDYYTKY